MTTALRPPPPSHPLLRLRLAPHGGTPQPIDRAWWPRSYDLLAELPRLRAGLPRAWGHITSVTINGATRSAGPGRMLVFNRARIAGEHRWRRTVGNGSAVAPGVPSAGDLKDDG
ncbi:DUF5994 family protein [Streptomyces collinus]|uniref:Uncharacterized protein n=1 Tax=Streptomyces collinus TaxID=42684 RepID=A0AA89Q605_STRCU|nr:DUF5994 family protein [Streptomyces collinus]MBB5814862.1 hypothetical protein [Streptomyces collinus]WMX67840.1 DUF5994 family protein [Streptomyces collinus]